MLLVMPDSSGSRSARSAESQASDGRLRAAALLVLFGFMVSAVASLMLWSTERHRAERALQSSADVLQHSMVDALGEAVLRLHAVAGLYESSEQVTSAEFHRFVKDLSLSPGLGAIGYVPVVSEEDLGAFVKGMRETIPEYAVFDIGPDGEPVPPAARPEHAPLQWLEPPEAFGHPQGLDSMSDPEYSDALERARSTGVIAATPFLRVVSESDDDGFILYYPVTDTETGTVVGFAAAAMDLNEVVDGNVPQALLDSLDWQVTDITAVDSPRSSTGSWADTLPVGGRLWQMTVTPRQTSDAIPNPAGALLVLFAGLAATALAAGVLNLYRQRAHSRRELEVLRQLTRARNEFLASVSHELRTPLTGVLGFAQVLRERTEDFDQRERASMVATIVDQATDLSHIIDDLLVSARDELDSLAVARVPVAIHAQVAQVIEEMPSVEGRIEVVADRTGSTRKALADPGRVRQVLRNLITNAIRYGGDRIQVRVVDDGDRVLLQVADDGVGVPSEESERIFESYHRAHLNGGQPAALGLGLNVARHLARLMDGDLTYRREGGWTVFELILPTADPSAAPSMTTDMARTRSA